MTITQPKLFQRCGGKDCPERLKCWRNQKPVEQHNRWQERQYDPHYGCEYFISLPEGFKPVDRNPDPLLIPTRD